MSTNWIAHVVMLCPTQHRADACLRAAYLTGNQSDGIPEFWSVPVYNEQDEIVYYMAHSRVRQIVLDLFPVLEQEFPGAIYKVTHEDQDHDPDPHIVLNWLKELGLKVYLEDDLILGNP